MPPKAICLLSDQLEWGRSCFAGSLGPHDRALLAWLKLAYSKKKPACIKKPFLKPSGQASRSPYYPPSPITNTVFQILVQSSPQPKTGLLENFLKTQIWGVFLHPHPIISACNSFLFGFREGKQLDKNHTVVMRPQAWSQCLGVPPVS